MIDIHSHVLPMVTNDDGVETYEEAIALVEKGYEEGLTGIIATPHVQSIVPPEYESELKEKQENLQQLLIKKGIAVKVYIGSEIYCDPAAVDVVKKKYLSLNETGKYVLVEFPMNSIPEGSDEVLFQIQLQGLTPIIAHPERNMTIIQKPNRLYELVQRGMYAQLTASSLLGRSGSKVQKLSKQLLIHRLVHFVASDAHHPRSRPLVLAEALPVVEELIGEHEAHDLFVTNPQHVINGEKIPAEDPEPIKTSFFSRIVELFEQS